MLELLVAGLIGSVSPHPQSALPTGAQENVGEEAARSDRIDLHTVSAELTETRSLDRAGNLELDGDCSKVGRETYLGRRQRRKECSVTAKLWHRLGTVRFQLSSSISRQRSRGTVSADLGEPRASVSKAYEATLLLPRGWRMSGGHFDRGGWDNRDLEALARQMSAGDGMKARGQWIEMGWSSAGPEGQTPSTSLAFRLERADALGLDRMQGGEVRAERRMNLTFATRY